MSKKKKTVKKKVAKKRKAKVLTIDGIEVYTKHDELVDAKKLKVNPKNPNIHPNKQVKKLADLIKEHGWRHPITISKRSGLIVAGHCRLLAALLIQITENKKRILVPVEYQDFKNAKAEKAVLISDNVIAEFNVLDDEAMSDYIVELNAQSLSVEDMQKITALDSRKIKTYLNGTLETNEQVVSFKAGKKLKCPECGHTFTAKEGKIEE